MDITTTPDRELLALFLLTETANSWWAGWLPVGHEVSARYFAWKARRRLRALREAEAAMKRWPDAFREGLRVTS